MKEMNIGDFFMPIQNIILAASQKGLYSKVCEPATPRSP
jgi:hypothetical protein